MVIKCPQCGVDQEKFPCDSCGYFDFGVLTLIGSCGSKTVNINTDIGNLNLSAVLSPDELRFYDRIQFHLMKSESKKSWVVIHNAMARNDTALNGSNCPAGREIAVADGDILAIQSKNNRNNISGAVQLKITSSK